MVGKISAMQNAKPNKKITDLSVRDGWLHDLEIKGWIIEENQNSVIFFTCLWPQITTSSAYIK